MAYSRDCVYVGGTVTLRAVLTDHCGEPATPDSLVLHLYGPDADVDADIEAEDFSGADFSVGPLSITEIAPGFYEYAWTVPGGAEAGTWRDVWVADFSGALTAVAFEVEVQDEVQIQLQALAPNTLVVILLDASIADTDGNELGEETQLSFSTLYEPYYASPDLLRLEAGPWLDQVPDDTLSLMIHWASLDADQYTPSGASGARFRHARTRFVVFDAIYRFLTLPVDAGSGQKKRLADLAIERSTDASRVLQEIARKRDEWLRVLNSGGTIVPGQGLGPTFGVKGSRDPDRRKMGRLWWTPEEVAFDQPTQNTKLLAEGMRRYRFGFRSR